MSTIQAATDKLLRACRDLDNAIDEDARREVFETCLRTEAFLRGAPAEDLADLAPKIALAANAFVNIAATVDRDDTRNYCLHGATALETVMRWLEEATGQRFDALRQHYGPDLLTMID